MILGFVHLKVSFSRSEGLVLHSLIFNYPCPTIPAERLNIRLIEGER